MPVELRDLYTVSWASGAGLHEMEPGVFTGKVLLHLHEPQGGRRPGRCLTANYHVMAVRVVDEDGEQVATTDAADELLDALTAFTRRDGAFETVELQGLEGDFVLWLEPFTE